MLIYNSITVSEMLKMDVFHDAELVAGKSGLDNEVNWIHPLEIWDDPHEWIDGGELIFSCALGVNAPDVLISFFSRLLERGIAGFCLQLHAFMREIPSEIICLANENNCPLIVFSTPVRFIDISRCLISTLMSNVNHDYLAENQKLEHNAWMVQWISSNLSNDQILDQLQMDPLALQKFSYFAVLVEYEKRKVSYRDSKGVYLTIAKNLEAYFEQNQFLFYPFFSEEMLAGIVFDFGKTHSWKTRFYNVVQEINDHFRKKETNPILILTAGVRTNQMDRIPNSYQTCRETMNICRNFKVDKYIYDDLGLFYFLSFFSDPEDRERICAYTQNQIAPLLVADTNQKGKLLETLKMYYACNGNKQLTAAELHISRRTLYYRLDQIEAIFGVDPLKTSKRIAMEIALMFYDYNK